jgi:uncharacterized protein YegL
MDDQLFEHADFADNPEPRCPVVLLLDTSGSMTGAPINELNGGLLQFAEELRQDRLASLRVEIALITFGGAVQAIDLRGSGQPIPFDAYQAFVTADRFQPPTLSPNGDTPMGEAVWRTLGLIYDRKAIYKQQGLDYFRPWVFLISDGEPNDQGWEQVAGHAIGEVERNGMLIFPIGVQGANLDTLARFSTAQPLLLRGLAFRELFRWVSKSLSAVAHSNPGDQIALPAIGWTTIPTGV